MGYHLFTGNPCSQRHRLVLKNKSLGQEFISSEYIYIEAEQIFKDEEGKIGGTDLKRKGTISSCRDLCTKW